MKGFRGNGGFLLTIILGALFAISAPSSFVIASSESDELVNKVEQTTHLRLSITHINEIKNKANDDIKSVITYQPINQASNVISDRDNEFEVWKLFEISVRHFVKDDVSFTIGSTFSRDSCQEPLSSALPIWKINKSSQDSDTFRLEFHLPPDWSGKALYLCLYDEKSGAFEHLGAEHRLHIQIDGKRRHDVIKRDTAEKATVVIGFRIEHSDKEPEFDDGVPIVRAATQIKLRLFGSGFTNRTKIAFTRKTPEESATCNKIATEYFDIEEISETNAVANVILPPTSMELFLCVSNDDAFVHQGQEKWLKLQTAEALLPLWVQLMIIFFCLCFSALFSGLNLGLMSLDRTDLKILCNTGTESEKKYAHAIQPVRDHGNFLLCSILLGNVLVNSTFTILLDSLTSGLIAVVCSTLLIVIFGEITPQAICSRHGLAVGARTILITKFVMFLTFPLSYPTSKILDRLLGEEIGTYYNRERLNELVKVTKDHNDLDKDEVNIISGVLEMRKKTVGDVMTPIEDAYMLPIDSILDFETISKIMNSGYSRIPVYEGDRKNILSLLYIKDLAFVDTDDNTPLRMLCEFYQNPCHFVFDDVTLDVMFKQFKEGNKGHMAFVHRVNNDGDGDPFYETIGLVTLEDVIEELIQAEIMDETDRITDNRTKNRRSRPHKQDFSFFVERRPDAQKVRISPQLTLAAFQYMSTTLDPFKRDMSENILRRLLNQDVVRIIKNKSKERHDPSMFIYSANKPVDYFVLILEGRVEVTVGKENLLYEGGPFTYFGLQALVQNVGFDSPQQQQGSQIMGSLQSLNVEIQMRHTFVPDYSVRAVSDVVYIMVKRSLYLAAKRATLMEQTKRLGEQSNEPLDAEVEKLLHSLDEDDSTIHTNMNSPRVSKPASPASQQHFLTQPPSSHHLHSESDSGMRVTFSQSNNIANFTNSQKASMDVHDDADPEVEQPLLNRTNHL